MQSVPLDDGTPQLVSSRARMRFNDVRFRLGTLSFLPLRFLDGDGAVMSDLNPRGSLPFSVYIDRKGGLHSTHDGFSSGDEVKIEKVVDQLIAEERHVLLHHWYPR